MTVNQGLIEGLWKCRNRPNDSPDQRRQTRNWLRQCIKVEKQRRLWSSGRTAL